MATETTVNDDIRQALIGILDAQDGLICPGCGKVYFHVDDALSDDDDAQWDVDMHDDGCQVVEAIASIKAHGELSQVSDAPAPDQLRYSARFSVEDPVLGNDPLDERERGNER